MADTTNFEWTKPVVDGSSGAWGQILNDALDAIDTDLKAVKDTADDAAAENIAKITLHTSVRGVTEGDSALFSRLSPSLGLQFADSADTGAITFYVPVSGLAPGMKITAMKSKGQADSGVALEVSLRSLNSNSGSSIHSTITHGTTQSELSDTFTASVTAGLDFFVRVQFNRTSGSGGASHMYVELTVERT